MATPRPTPTKLRLLRGNPGRRPLPKGEPSSTAGRPTCPSWLPQVARVAWREIAEHLEGMELLALEDRKALELLVAAYAEWRSALEVVRLEGAYYDTTNQSGGTMIRAHPARADAAEAWRRVRSMLIEFGLTPAARSKVHPVGEPPADALEEFLRRGRKDEKRGPGSKA